MRVAGALEPVPPDVGREAGHRSPVYHRAETLRAHLDTDGPVDLTCTSLGRGGKPEHPEETATEPNWGFDPEPSCL